MKKARLFIGALLLLTSFSLASCDLLSDDSSNTTPKTSDNSGGSSQDATTKYTVKFNTNGGTSVSSQKIEDGKTVTKPTDPKRTGYSFIGWYSDESCNSEYDFATAITGNITIYAKWSIESYTVSFDVKGGNETIVDQTIEYNGTVTKPTDPTKDGYTFGGWYTSSYYLTEYSFSNKVTRSLTLYAKWNEIPKTVKYEVGTPTVTIWTNSINSKWIKVGVPITNTGTADLYLNDCSIDIESSTGTLLKTMTYISGYPEYIKPGETGYYYDETTVDFSETNVVAVPNVQVEKATNDVIRYTISDVTITSDTYNGIKVMGRVQNNTTSKGTLVKVAANLFDSNGKLICNCFTYLENDLSAGSKVGFTITPFAYTKVTPSDVASYEVYAYPTQYNW